MIPAPFSNRLMAYNLDITIFLLFAFSVSYFVASNTVMYGLAFIFICLYHSIFESSSLQATLGKKQGRMKVVGLKNDRISFFRSLLRILAKFVSLGLFFSGFFLIYFRKDKRGLHDLIAGTKVILVD